MSRIWYVGDSWVDPNYTGRHQYENQTSWVQDTATALGCNRNIINCACAGSSPDWAITELFKQQHLWNSGGAQDDVMIVSISDFSRLNQRSLVPSLQHNSTGTKLGTKVFREIHNAYWDWQRCLSTMMLIQSISVHWRRVMLLTPFGIPRSGNNFSRVENQDIANQLVTDESNMWWFPRFLFYYDHMSSQRARIPDPRPNHITGPHNTAMYNSSMDWFIRGERNVYKPYKKMAQRHHGI